MDIPAGHPRVTHGSLKRADGKTRPSTLTRITLVLKYFHNGPEANTPDPKTSPLKSRRR